MYFAFVTQEAFEIWCIFPSYNVSQLGLASFQVLNSHTFCSCYARDSTNIGIKNIRGTVTEMEKKKIHVILSEKKQVITLYLACLYFYNYMLCLQICHL